jgi:hypothetical protein
VGQTDAEAEGEDTVSRTWGGGTARRPLLLWNVEATVF